LYLLHKRIKPLNKQAMKENCGAAVSEAEKSLIYCVMGMLWMGKSFHGIFAGCHNVEQRQQSFLATLQETAYNKKTDFA
jgi:hypothetical protein